MCMCMCTRAQGSPKPLGRAFAEPEFKTVEQYYQKPRLHFYDINMGRVAAGELLAAFELIELDYSGFGEVTPACRSISDCIYYTLARIVCPLFLLVTLFVAEIWENCDVITERRFEKSCWPENHQAGNSSVGVPSCSLLTQGLLVRSLTRLLLQHLC